MKSPPKGWPRLSLSVHYQDAPAAIDWLCRAFDFELQLKVEGDGGVIVHSELKYGEALIMVGGEGGKEPWQSMQHSPQSLAGAVTASACLFVDDVDAHHARAVAA